MDISECTQFVNFFSEVASSDSHGYLTLEQGDYKVTAVKSDKTLNTEEIAELANSCFRTFANHNLITETESGLEERQDRMRELSSLSQAYLTKVYYSKPWYLRILAFFGIKSHAERDLGYIAAKAATIAERTEVWHAALQKELEEEINQPKAKLRHFFNAVLGYSPLLIPNLDGVNRLPYQHSLLKHLNEFRVSVQKDSPGELEKFDQLITELEFAYFLGLNFSDPEPLLPLYDVLDILVEKVKNLSTYSDGTAESFVLLGGHSGTPIISRGHAVLYSIQKDDGYQFTIVDSDTPKKEEKVGTLNQHFNNEFLPVYQRAYAEVAAVRNAGQTETDIEQLKDDLQIASERYVEEYHAFVDFCKKSKLQNTAYGDLTEEKLDQEFFKKLCSVTGPTQRHSLKDVLWSFLFYFPTKFKWIKEKEMSDVIQEIEHYLLNPEQSNKCQQGRAHRSQLKRDCGVRCISLYMRSKLGDILYQKLKVFLTEKFIEEFEAAVHDTPEKELDELLGKGALIREPFATIDQDLNLVPPEFTGSALIDKMRDEAQIVLDRRRNKLAELEDLQQEEEDVEIE